MGINPHDAAQAYRELNEHYGHYVTIARYAFDEDGEPANVAVECEDCHLVLLDYDRPTRETETSTAPPTELSAHDGHAVKLCRAFGDDRSDHVVVRCEDCNVVLADYGPPASPTTESSTTPDHAELSDRDVAIVLAALRYWQEENTAEVPALRVGEEHFDGRTPPDASEIDDICERINIRSGISASDINLRAGILLKIQEFRAQCEDAEYTDVGNVWELLDWIESAVADSEAEKGRI